MPSPNRLVYLERTPWPAWIWVVLGGSLSVSAMLVVAGGGAAPIEGRVMAVAAIVGVAVGLPWLIGGLTVRLYPDRLVVGLGNGRIFKSSLAYERMEKVEVVRYSPLADFGGWGYRGRGNKRAWTARGDEAVVLHLRDGRELYIGSDHPDRLRERIMTIGGSRIGGPGRPASG